MPVVYYEPSSTGGIRSVMEFDDPKPILDTEGNIIGYEDDVNDYIKAHYIKTDRKIVQTFDGKYQFEDEVDWTAEEAKKQIAALEATQQQLTQAVQDHMDSTAQTKGYDNIHTACSYYNSTDHIFATEGQACLQWRDKVWRTCYNILDEVKAGTRKIPTAEELIAELPVLEW